MIIVETVSFLQLEINLEKGNRNSFAGNKMQRKKILLSHSQGLLIIEHNTMKEASVQIFFLLCFCFLNPKRFRNFSESSEIMQELISCVPDCYSNFFLTPVDLCPSGPLSMKLSPCHAYSLGGDFLAACQIYL